MKIFSKIFLFYCFFFSLFIVVSPFLFGSKNLTASLLFLPVPVYFLVVLKSEFTKKEDSQSESLGKKKFFYFLISIIFLTSIGIANVVSSKKEDSENQSIPAIPGEKASSPDTRNSAIIFGQPKDTTTQPTQSPKKQVKISSPGGFVNIRKDSSTSSEKLGEAFNDEVFYLVEKENGWFKIVLNDESTGWVFGEYVIELE